MFCPQCGISQSEELKFCKSCGANLKAVRQVVATRDTDKKTDGKIDWSKTWVAEILLSGEEQKRRRQERQRSVNPEVKRYNEIKAGVITSCVGLGVMLFLYVFMNGIILGENIPQSEKEILSRIWVAGVIPFFIGLGLLLNGVFVSKKLVEIAKQELQAKETLKALETPTKSIEDPSLPSADWYAADSPRPSVTEHTTRELRNSE
ncbi:MAG: zinc ribbon domain-containing protein [Acidobacteria bacterium]|nr:zinc ribbon domain-containing protein [Acidobacteriota bacterium]